MERFNDTNISQLGQTSYTPQVASVEYTFFSDYQVSKPLPLSNEEWNMYWTMGKGPRVLINDVTNFLDTDEYSNYADSRIR